MIAGYDTIRYNTTQRNTAGHANYNVYIYTYRSYTARNTRHKKPIICKLHESMMNPMRVLQAILFDDSWLQYPS